MNQTIYTMILYWILFCTEIVESSGYTFCRLIWSVQMAKPLLGCSRTRNYLCRFHNWLFMLFTENKLKFLCTFIVKYLNNFLITPLEISDRWDMRQLRLFWQFLKEAHNLESGFQKRCLKTILLFFVLSFNMKAPK